MHQCSEEKVGTFMLHGNPLERRDKVVRSELLPGPQPLFPTSDGRQRQSKHILPSVQTGIWLVWVFGSDEAVD